MIKRISLLMVAALMAAMMMVATAAPAFAISPSEQACIDRGGHFERVNGQTQCVVTEEGKNKNFTQETTTTGQGNEGNKTESKDVCTGTGSGKCPHGQFS